MFKKLTNIIILFAILLIATQAIAITSQKIVDESINTYENAKLIQGKIQQTRINPKINKKSISRGKFYITHPDKFRIEYTYPEKQTIVSNGDSMWIYTASNNQVIVQEAQNTEEFIFQYFENSDSELITEHEKINSYPAYLIKLDPKEDMYPDIKSMQAWINKATYLPEQIQITDINDNIVYYTFTDKVIKDKIDENLYNFEIPDGVEVFNQ